ncbi:MAG: 5'-3' exonuclease H3TH domain-containing protein [Thalassolituus sp.]
MQLLIIDAMNLIRRVYAAAEGSEAAFDATCSRALSIIHSNAKRIKATHWLMVWEDHETTWRHRLWPDYKAGRSPMPEALARCLPDIRRYLEANGVYGYNLSGWEADDIIASVAAKAAERAIGVTILSTDKGFCQLVSPVVHVLNHFDRLLWDVEQVRERWGAEPSQLTDYWALCGDQTNHLPGVAGIGKKGAGEVLEPCGSLDVALGWPEKLPERLRKLLSEDTQSALQSRVLATLRTDVTVGLNLGALRARS